MPLVILLGIWSISALNAIPGLAVSPILGQMSTIFPQSSEFDIQLLSSLPSLLVATDCSKCFAGDRLGPYRSFIDRTDLALFHGEI